MFEIFGNKNFVPSARKCPVRKEKKRKLKLQIKHRGAPFYFQKLWCVTTIF